MAIWVWEAVFDHKREMMMAGLDIREGKKEWKEIGVWHLSAPHLPEQLLLIVYPHLSRDKKWAGEGGREQFVSILSAKRGDIWNVLHINARVIAFFRRFSNLMDEKRERGGWGNKVWLRGRAGVKVCEIVFFFFFFNRVREFEVIFSWLFNTHYSRTSVRAAMAEVNDLANRREFNLTLPSQNGNN